MGDPVLFENRGCSRLVVAVLNGTGGVEKAESRVFKTAGQRDILVPEEDKIGRVENARISRA